MTGEELKALREKAGLTQKELADKLGTKRERVSDWENNKRKMSGAYLRILKNSF